MVQSDGEGERPERTLWRGFEQVKANDGAAGVDHQTVEDFERNLIQNLKQLSEQLRDGTLPAATGSTEVDRQAGQHRTSGRWEFRRFAIGWCKRRCGLVLEPIFERDFAEQSYGFRPNRGCKDALRRVDDLLKQGATWIVDADLKSYLDTASYCPHD